MVAARRREWKRQDARRAAWWRDSTYREEREREPLPCSRKVRSARPVLGFPKLVSLALGKC